jgi:hypothetical protein
MGIVKLRYPSFPWKRESIFRPKDINNPSEVFVDRAKTVLKISVRYLRSQQQ